MITEKDKRIILQCAKKYNVSFTEKYQPEKIILFGSYAYGEPDEDSDVKLW